VRWHKDGVWSLITDRLFPPATIRLPAPTYLYILALANCILYRAGVLPPGRGLAASNAAGLVAGGITGLGSCAYMKPRQPAIHEANS
jgi:hypothetical protein